MVIFQTNLKNLNYALNQACQTQTTSWAANATKSDKRAAKVFKKS